MIIDCVIRWNKVSWGTGGGICSYGGGSPTIRSCVVDGNAAGSSLLPCYGVGGGMALSGGTVEDCIIVGNRASDYGGGLSCGSGTDISHCTFQGNESYYAYGGALSVGFASITDCLFSGNSTAGSPAVHVFGSATFQGCLLCNEAFALYVWQWSGPPSAIPTIRNCTFCRNGKGIRMYDGTSLVIENTIVAHTTGSSAIGCGETNDVTITCCDLYANAGGSWVGCLEDQYGINGNFSGCPSFCAAHAGDFHLCDQSPCLPGNHPDGYDCGLIGAWDVGCSCGPTATESTTWGEIKAEFGD
jgi:hypothetical protein